ncbi:hypothetical protein ACFOKI_05630 [Sphingomonas qilianensis]|uniref:Uncharacterized protein n=1 Tax=Sphingomonas qilianensis TaxID=1736690 RepID=A0ABU9XSI8_9SPHN
MIRFMSDTVIDPPEGAAPDPALLASQMMADLQASNPQLAMIAQMMQARAIVPSPVSEDLGEHVVELADRLAEAHRRIDAMKKSARRLYQSHHEAQARLADLAAALGACGLCWGEDDRCPSCRGRGRPGMVRPDPELRATLLGPLQSHASQARTSPSRQAAQQDTTQRDMKGTNDVQHV